MDEPKRGRKGNLGSKLRGFAQKKCNARRVHESYVIDVDNILQRNSLLFALVLHDQMTAGVPDLIHEIENDPFHDAVAKCCHQQRDHNERNKLNDRLVLRDSESKACAKKECKKSEPGNRKHSVV